MLNILAGAGTMCPAHNGFINIYVAIPDFQVEPAIRIGANPCLVVNSCPLTAKIRQGHQVSRVTLLTFRETELFHGVLLPAEIESLTVYTNQRLLTRASSDQLS